jgi:hypothetical protein
MEAKEALPLVEAVEVRLLLGLHLVEITAELPVLVLQTLLVAHRLHTPLEAVAVLLALVVLVELAQVTVVQVLPLVVLQLVTVAVVVVPVLALLVQDSKALSLFVTSQTKKG